MSNKIEPDQALLLAWARATTGSNQHDMSRAEWYYKDLCEHGETEKAQDQKEYMQRRLRVLFKQNGYDRFQR